MELFQWIRELTAACVVLCLFFWELQHQFPPLPLFDILSVADKSWREAVQLLRPFRSAEAPMMLNSVCNDSVYLSIGNDGQEVGSSNPEQCARAALWLKADWVKILDLYRTEQNASL